MTLPKSDLSSFGALLKSFRTYKHLTQQQLAKAVGVHRHAIGRWEQGDFLPSTKGMVLELAKHLHLNEQETRQLLEASLTALAPHWSVPLPRNPYFTGREEVLEALHAQLGVDQAVALTQSSALHGLGGIGKTQIALEYAYQHALEYSAVFWVGAETEEQIVSSLLRIAEVLQLPEREDKDQQRVVTAVQRWLSTHGQWLLIWDNVEDLALLNRFLPSARSGAILLTTCRQTLGTLAQGLDLLPMDQEDGLLFLLHRAKVLSPEGTSEQVHQLAIQAPAQYAAASELVTILGGLPLALDQAGAYLEETRCGLPAYLNLFRTRRDALLHQRGEGIHDHPASVSTTFTLAITAAAERHPAVRDLLQVCALLQPDAIPEEIFRQGAEHLGTTLEAACCDPLEWDRVMGVACSYSLLSRQPEEQTLSMHRLVQAVLLDAVNDEEREWWSVRVIAALDVALPEVQRADEYAAWKQCECLLPHVLLSLQRTGAASESLPLASLAYKTAYHLFRRGQHIEAELLFQRALQIREQILGPEHPDVATSLNDLALACFQQSKYAEAESLYQRALRILEQVLGTDHPEVAYSLNGLGEIRAEQGKYEQSKMLFNRALLILEQAWGSMHPCVAEQLNNLAFIYHDQGKYEQAELLYQRALFIRERLLGTDHPDTAVYLNNLAVLYRNQRKYEQAEPLQQRALHIWEQALGPEHPRVVVALSGLANLFREQGKYAESGSLYQRALHIGEQTLGYEHPRVSAVLNGLANLCREQSKHPEAESLFQRALSIREQHLGLQHPETAETLHDLALLCQKQGNLNEANSLAERALKIRSQTLGDAHPKTISTRELSAQLLQEQAAGAESTLEQLRTLLKARGWSMHLKKRRGKSYVYATRRVSEHTQSRYLAPLSNLAACLAAAWKLPNAKEE